VNRKYNSSPWLGPNRVEFLDKRMYVHILVVYVPETILKDNKLSSQRNTRVNEDPSLNWYLHTWELLYYNVSPYLNM
jgi:hypothetical protein